MYNIKHTRGHPSAAGAVDNVRGEEHVVYAERRGGDTTRAIEGAAAAFECACERDKTITESKQKKKEKKKDRFASVYGRSRTHGTRGIEY